ncbi:MnhB domain-containing protein [Ferroglobus placidus]|uniref:MnhB domain-containing protein n=1 Tax=Ferroglobus placidus TaxID=54261 RepID=UPI00064EA23D|nr:MnhB domain-containing protein [Ferroglobus placidus]
MSENVVIKTTVRTMLPFIQLYGFYVMTGTEGAGGGFQGGVILAASFILYAITFGAEKGRRAAPESWNTAFKSLGLWIYAGVGMLTVLYSLGRAEFLNYSATFLSLFVPHTVARGILIADVIEVGIGMTVAASFVSLFFDLVWKGDEDGHS